MADSVDTICALATAPGRSGLALVRVSGSSCLSIYRKIFKSKNSKDSPKPRMARLGRISDPVTGMDIDEAVVVYYKAPKSYTGEDMTEYSIHGSPALITSLLEYICRNGARLAEPGEFTMRAFLNGKMDLIQAEAVGDIIESNTLYQAQVASRQRFGGISKGIEPIRKMLTEIIVQLESAVEFAEENLSIKSREDIKKDILGAGKEIEKWIDSFRRGRIVRNGLNLAIIGRPNVGKSSLFNALLMQDRSIVMDLPGTTRDLVSEFTNIGGIPVRLLDTAGIHASADSVENIGMDRTYQAISDADSVLVVVDRSRTGTESDQELRRGLRGQKCIVVMNKCDLQPEWDALQIEEFSADMPYIEVSAKNGEGIEKLRSMIFNEIFGESGIQQDDILVTNLRHCNCLEDVKTELLESKRALEEGLSEEFALVHLHKCLKGIGAITGETTTEDILGAIFSRFCIGK